MMVIDSNIGKLLLGLDQRNHYYYHKHHVLGHCYQTPKSGYKILIARKKTWKQMAQGSRNEKGERRKS